jgi:hypothetical protein
MKGIHIRRFYSYRSTLENKREEIISCAVPKVFRLWKSSSLCVFQFCTVSSGYVMVVRLSVVLAILPSVTDGPGNGMLHYMFVSYFHVKQNNKIVVVRRLFILRFECDV